MNTNHTMSSTAPSAKNANLTYLALLKCILFDYSFLADTTLSAVQSTLITSNIPDPEKQKPAAHVHLFDVHTVFKSTS